jgi:mercuric ion binding protein
MKTSSFIFITIALLLGLAWSSFSFASGSQYDLRVDGLACPFCAYGIEKKFTKTEGVASVGIDLGKGLVIVQTVDGKIFEEDELKTIIHDAGFTMRSMIEKPR